jgi:hypothetical protein
MVYGEVEVNLGLDGKAPTVIFDLGSASEDDSQLMQSLFQGTIRTLAWKDRWKPQQT